MAEITPSALQLPSELLRTILVQLDIETLLCASHVCAAWKACASALWKTRYLSLNPDKSEYIKALASSSDAPWALLYLTHRSHGNALMFNKPTTTKYPLSSDVKGLSELIPDETDETMGGCALTASGREVIIVSQKTKEIVCRIPQWNNERGSQILCYVPGLGHLLRRLDDNAVDYWVKKNALVALGVDPMIAPPAHPPVENSPFVLLWTTARPENMSLPQFHVDTFPNIDLLMIRITAHSDAAPGEINIHSLSRKVAVPSIPSMIKTSGSFTTSKGPEAEQELTFFPRATMTINWTLKANPPFVTDQFILVLCANSFHIFSRDKSSYMFTINELSLFRFGNPIYELIPEVVECDRRSFETFVLDPLFGEHDPRYNSVVMSGVISPLGTCIIVQDLLVAGASLVFRTEAGALLILPNYVKTFNECMVMFKEEDEQCRQKLRAEHVAWHTLCIDTDQDGFQHDTGDVPLAESYDVVAGGHLVAVCMRTAVVVIDTNQLPLTACAEHVMLHEPLPVTVFRMGLAHQVAYDHIRFAVDKNGVYEIYSQKKSQENIRVMQFGKPKMKKAAKIKTTGTKKTGETGKKKTKPKTTGKQKADAQVTAIEDKKSEGSASAN